MTEHIASNKTTGAKEKPLIDKCLGTACPRESSTANGETKMGRGGLGPSTQGFSVPGETQENQGLTNYGNAGWQNTGFFEPKMGLDVRRRIMQ